MHALPTGDFMILLGSLKTSYLINEHLGTSILRNQYTSITYVNFYVTKRVSAGLLDPVALRLLKVAA